MDQWMCPDCGTAVSRSARRCPFCGFEDSERGAIAVVRTRPDRRWFFDESCTELDRVMINAAMDASAADGLLNILRNVAMVAPAGQGVLDAMKAIPTLVADLPADKMAALAKGTLRLSRDKQGNILAAFVNQATNEYDSQIRLKEAALYPNAPAALANLQTQAALAEIIGHLSDIADELSSVSASLEDDRLAVLESAWDQLLQAMEIQDPRVRQAKLLLLQSSATEARAKLQRSFQRQMSQLLAPKARDGKQKLNRAAAAAFAELEAIARATKIETVIYSVLGEDMSARVALEQHAHFMAGNRLDDRDTLLKINSASATDRPEVMEHYGEFLRGLTEQLSVEGGDSSRAIEESPDE